MGKKIFEVYAENVVYLNACAKQERTPNTTTQRKDPTQNQTK